jgi:putative ferrous iron transport protein C
MNLTDLKSYLLQHEQVTLTDLAIHFRVAPETVATMLAHWIRKGKVEQQKLGVCNKGCCKTNNNIDVYRWIKIHQED